MKFEKISKPSASVFQLQKNMPAVVTSQLTGQIPHKDKLSMQEISTNREMPENQFDTTEFGYCFANIPVNQAVVQGKSQDFLRGGTAVQNESHTTLPQRLKVGIEQLSGLSMDDVKVHRNSSSPGQFQAHAYTLGTDIHLASGQERHLPHEAWHVVQQKQGRVMPTDVRAKDILLNDDPNLESEADQMGAKALKDDVVEPMQRNSQAPVLQAVQRKVMQCEKVPTDFGEFETTKFAEAEGRGVEIILKFKPNETKVDAKKIALSQSIRNTDASGKAYALGGPNVATKMVGSGKSGEGFTIDTNPGTTNPLYGERNNLSATQDLKDTPQSANTTTDPVKLGKNSSYELGHCYKEKPADTEKKKHPAGLWDKPLGDKAKGVSKTFETTALAIEGTDKGKYYGSVKWGYKMEGTTEAPTVTKTNITEASKGTPTANFIEAAKLWNAGKTQGTLEVTAHPEATVLKGDASATEKLAKGTKLKHMVSVIWEGSPWTKVEVLKADGTGSGKIIYIKNSDIKDVGDGSPNKKLPV
jgi:hypothetical protein